MKNDKIKLILCLLLSAVVIFGILCMPALASNSPYGDNDEEPGFPDGSEVPEDHTHKYSVWFPMAGVDKHVRHCECGALERGECSFDNGRVTTKPTYESDGVKTYTCTVCYVTKTEKIDRLKPGEPNPYEEKSDNTILWVVILSVAVVAVAGTVVAVILIKKKKTVESDSADEKKNNQKSDSKSEDTKKQAKEK